MALSSKAYQRGVLGLDVDLKLLAETPESNMSTTALIEAWLDRELLKKPGWFKRLRMILRKIPRERKFSLPYYLQPEGEERDQVCENLTLRFVGAHGSLWWNLSIDMRPDGSWESITLDPGPLAPYKGLF